MERIKKNSINFATILLLGLFLFPCLSQADPKLYLSEPTGLCVLSAEMVAASGHNLGQSTFATIHSVSAKACEKEASKSQEYRVTGVCGQALYRDREPASEQSTGSMKFKISYQFIPEKKGSPISGSGQSGLCPKSQAVSSN